MSYCSSRFGSSQWIELTKSRGDRGAWSKLCRLHRLHRLHRLDRRVRNRRSGCRTAEHTQFISFATRSEERSAIFSTQKHFIGWNSHTVRIPVGPCCDQNSLSDAGRQRFKHSLVERRKLQIERVVDECVVEVARQNP